MTALARTAVGRSWMLAGAARLAGRLAALSGLKRYGLALLLGVLAAGSLPPLYLLPLLWPAFVGLLWMLDGVERDRQALALGWWFGLGYFLAGLYWVGISMLVDPWRFGWMIPFAVGGLSAGMALYPAIALWIAWRAEASGTSRILLLAASWVLCEWLRGHLLSGFPWNLIGYGWTIDVATMQLAAYAGIYGLSFVTIVAAALPALLAAPAGPESWILRRPWLPLALPLVIVAALWGGGAWRLTQAPDPASPDAMQPGIRLRVVQPNIAESLKWQPARLRANLLEMVQTSRVGLDGDKLLIWPEASVPYDLGSEPELRHALGAILPKDGYLATGTPRREPNEGGTGDNAFRYFNSLELVDHAGDIVATYDKSHLVPYGEYVPMRSILPIAKITPGTIDFSSGPGPRTVSVPGLPPFGVLICYEAIFPDEAVERDHRPDWLLNVTNDAWFGTSSGPYQHFESTRMRAVEQGLPLVRAANTGISGVIDPYGRVLTRVGLGERRVFDSGLPRPLAEPTPYARFGDATLILLIAFATALAWLLRKLR